MKLCIVGKAGSWAYCPKDTTIWCVSTIYERLIRAGYNPSLVFQLHRKGLHEAWLRDIQSKVVLIRPDAGLPKAVVLDAEALLKKFGMKFTSSVSWMMAYAIQQQKYDTIEFFGLNMDHDSEYGRQRDSFFYFYGRAEESGINLITDPDSGIHIAESKYGL